MKLYYIYGGSISWGALDPCSMCSCPNMFLTISGRSISKRIAVPLVNSVNSGGNILIKLQCKMCLSIYPNSTIFENCECNINETTEGSGGLCTPPPPKQKCNFYSEKNRTIREQRKRDSRTSLHEIVFNVTVLKI